MSRLQELIKRYCPDGVEYKRIGDVFTRIKGTPITAATMKKIACENGEIRIYAGGRNIIQAREEDIPKANITRVPAVLVQSRGVIGFVYVDVPFTFKNEMWAYTHPDRTVLQFLAYCLMNNVDDFRRQASGMGSLPQISIGVTDNYRIPVPPIEDQREVVRILDEYTAAHDELVGQLEEEVAYRNEQLSLSRKQAFTNELWPKRPLGEVFETVTGSTPKKSNASYFGDEHPFYKPGDLVHGSHVANTVDGLSDAGISASRVVESGSVLVTCIGATIGKTAMAEARGACNQQINAVLPSDDCDMRFYLHFCCSEAFQKQIREKGSFDNMPIISRGKFNKLLVPVPPREDQSRVADELDCLTDVMSGYLAELESEIVLLKAQLVEVSNKLLSFPEKAVR